MQMLTKCFTSRCSVAAAAVIAAMAVSTTARASLDGSLTLDDGYGITPLTTQVNVTTSNSADGGNTGGVADEATASNTGRLNQMSNAYAYIDSTTTPGSPVLRLFIGGSVEQVTADSHIELALQTKSGGVTSLAGQNLPGNLPNVKFQGFSPNVLFTLTPFDSAGGIAGDGGTSVKNLISASSAGVNIASNNTGSDAGADLMTVGMKTNDALDTVAIGAHGTNDPGFAGASTGMEFAIPLNSLPGADTGYVSGDIKAFLFFAEGSYGRTNNQLLAPFHYGTDSNAYDYTYIGDTADGIPGSTSRQFGADAYPVLAGGTQYFTIPGAAVPEPASLSLIALGSAGLLSRRTRKA